MPGDSFPGPMSIRFFQLKHLLKVLILRVHFLKKVRISHKCLLKRPKAGPIKDSVLFTIGPDSIPFEH